MPIRELQYPVEPYSKANRLKERGEFAPCMYSTTRGTCL